MNPDLFLSHATEDKDAFVRPLAHALQGLGLEVWYDEFSLRPGDSLRKSIDAGLASARFGVVVLSEAFFAKRWTEWELNGLVQRQVGSGEKLIIPIWHDVNAERVRQFSPSLADIVAIRSCVGIGAAAHQIQGLVSPKQSAPSSKVSDQAPTNQEAAREALATAISAASELMKWPDGERPRITVFKMQGDLMVKVGSDQAHSEGPLSMTIPSSIVTYSARVLQPVIVPDTNAVADARFALRADLGPLQRVASTMAIPLMGDGHLYGVVALDSKKAHFFGEQSTGVASSVAYLLGPFVRAVKVDDSVLGE